MSWKKLLESAKESLNDHLRLRNEYLMAENRILRNQINGRVQLTNSERKELAEIGAKLGKKALAEIAIVAQPDTILAWNRKFANQPTDTAERPKSVGRPRVNKEIEDWVLRMARENRSWGYDRIQGSLNHLGYPISDQTVGNILKRHGISPAPERKKTVTWREFIRSHWDVLAATGFFHSEVWSGLGLVMSYLLSFIRFSRPPVQSVKMTLHQQMRVVHVPIQRLLDGCLSMRKWLYVIVPRSRARRVSEIILEQTGSTFEFADEQLIRSQEMGKGVVLSAVQPQRIRDGPIRSRPKRSDPLRDVDRQAA
jgi:transposase